MQKAPRRRRWIWFFLLLGVLTVVAASVEIWFNLRQQVTETAVKAAQDRWRTNGPVNYDMKYTFKTIDNSDAYNVVVRNKKVSSATWNGEALAPERYRYCTMPYLLEIVADYLREDSKPDAPRTFAVANFDPLDGHLIHYVRSVMSKRERQEITVDFRQLDGQEHSK